MGEGTNSLAPGESRDCDAPVGAREDTWLNAGGAERNALGSPEGGKPTNSRNPIS